MIKNIIKNYFIAPIAGAPRFIILKNVIEAKHIKILDVGCGNQSAKLTKKRFPLCKYFGIDIVKDYNNFLIDTQYMEKFWLLDIENSDMNEIPNNYFDVIILSHIIEHLNNIKPVLFNLSFKLKRDGILYIEFPSFHTQFLPSLKKINVTFNFYDDITHKKAYKKEEICKILEKNNFKIIRSKIYLNFGKIFFLPILILYRFSKEHLQCFYELWTLVGWCTYILAIKQQ